MIYNQIVTWTAFAILAMFGKESNMIFRKLGGGGSKAVWNFSENSSVLVSLPSPVPKFDTMIGGLCEERLPCLLPSILMRLLLSPRNLQVLWEYRPL